MGIAWYLLYICSQYVHMISHIEAETKWPTFSTRHFQMHFLVWKCMNLDFTKIVPMVRINNVPALVQIMAWRRIGDKPLSEPMMVNILTLICVTRPHWVNHVQPGLTGYGWLKYWNLFIFLMELSKISVYLRTNPDSLVPVGHMTVFLVYIYKIMIS